MSTNICILIGVMAAVGLISALLTYIRTEKMAPPAETASKGLAAAQRGNMIFFGLFIDSLLSWLTYPLD